MKLIYENGIIKNYWNKNDVPHYDHIERGTIYTNNIFNGERWYQLQLIKTLLSRGEIVDAETKARHLLSRVKSRNSSNEKDDVVEGCFLNDGRTLLMEILYQKLIRKGENNYPSIPVSSSFSYNDIVEELSDIQEDLILNGEFRGLKKKDDTRLYAIYYRLLLQLYNNSYNINDIENGGKETISECLQRMLNIYKQLSFLPGSTIDCHYQYMLSTYLQYAIKNGSIDYVKGMIQFNTDIINYRVSTFNDNHVMVLDSYWIYSNLIILNYKKELSKNEDENDIISLKNAYNKLLYVQQNSKNSYYINNLLPPKIQLLKKMIDEDNEYESDV